MGGRYVPTPTKIAPVEHFLICGYFIIGDVEDRGGSVCLNSDLGLDEWSFCQVQAAAGCGSLSK